MISFICCDENCLIYIASLNLLQNNCVYYGEDQLEISICILYSTIKESTSQSYMMVECECQLFSKCYTKYNALKDSKIQEKIKIEKIETFSMTRSNTETNNYQNTSRGKTNFKRIQLKLLYLALNGSIIGHKNMIHRFLKRTIKQTTRTTYISNSYIAKTTMFYL